MRIPSTLPYHGYETQCGCVRLRIVVLRRSFRTACSTFQIHYVCSFCFRQFKCQMVICFIFSRECDISFAGKLKKSQFWVCHVFGWFAILPKCILFLISTLEKWCVLPKNNIFVSIRVWYASLNWWIICYSCTHDYIHYSAQLIPSIAPHCAVGKPSGTIMFNEIFFSHSFMQWHNGYFGPNVRLIYIEIHHRWLEFETIFRLFPLRIFVFLSFERQNDSFFFNILLLKEIRYRTSIYS